MLALYQSMSHQVTTYTDRVIDKATRFLPLPCRHLVKEKYRTESRIMTLWLGGVAIAQGAIVGSTYGSGTLAYSGTWAVDEFKNFLQSRGETFFPGSENFYIAFFHSHSLIYSNYAHSNSEFGVSTVPRADDRKRFSII